MIGSMATSRFSVLIAPDELAPAVVVEVWEAAVVVADFAAVEVVESPPRLMTPPGFWVFPVATVVVVDEVAPGLTTGTSLSWTRMVMSGASNESATTPTSQTNGT